MLRSVIAASRSALSGGAEDAAGFLLWIPAELPFTGGGTRRDFDFRARDELFEDERRFGEEKFLRSQKQQKIIANGKFHCIEKFFREWLD